MTAMYRRISKIKKDESGVVSLIIVSILAVVLGLVAVGFSQLTNRELQQASDRELSAEAFYAAEAGLNDAIAYLQAGGPVPLNGCSDWKNNSIGPQYFTDDLSPTPGTAKYTCVSIDDTTGDLIYGLKAGQSVTVKLNEANMDKLIFGWENPGDVHTALSPAAGSFGTLPQESASSIYGTVPTTAGVLRVGMYQVPAGYNTASYTNDDLAKLSRNFFMYPDAGAGPTTGVAYGSGNYDPAAGPSGTNGSFIHGNCHVGASPRFCNSYVNTLAGSNNVYYLQLTALYTDLNITLQAQDSSGKALTFKGVQGEVDVTGKGTDVLQRIRARVDLSRKYQYPDFALQSMEAICKGFTVDITAPDQYGTNVVDTMPNPDGSCAQPGGGDAATGTGGDLSPH